MCLFVFVLLVVEWTFEKQTIERVDYCEISSIGYNTSLFLVFLRQKISKVTAVHMNSVLGSVLKLIHKNIDENAAPWMKRIAVYTQTIIFNSSTSLLEPCFLPVSQSLRTKCEELYGQKLSLKHATRLKSTDREDMESNLMKVKFPIFFFAFCQLLD